MLYLSARWRDWGKGQGLVEYALLLMLVAVVMIAIVMILGPGLTNAYSNIVATM